MKEITVINQMENIYEYILNQKHNIENECLKLNSLQTNHVFPNNIIDIYEQNNKDIELINKNLIEIKEKNEKIYEERKKEQLKQKKNNLYLTNDDIKLLEKNKIFIKSTNSQKITKNGRRTYATCSLRCPGHLPHWSTTNHFFQVCLPQTHQLLC